MSALTKAIFISVCLLHIIIVATSCENDSTTVKKDFDSALINDSVSDEIDSSVEDMLSDIKYDTADNDTHIQDISDHHLDSDEFDSNGKNDIQDAELDDHLDTEGDGNDLIESCPELTIAQFGIDSPLEGLYPTGVKSLVSYYHLVTQTEDQLVSTITFEDPYYSTRQRDIVSDVEVSYTDITGVSHKVSAPMINGRAVFIDLDPPIYVSKDRYYEWIWAQVTFLSVGQGTENGDVFTLAITANNFQSTCFSSGTNHNSFVIGNHYPQGSDMHVYDTYPTFKLSINSPLVGTRSMDMLVWEFMFGGRDGVTFSSGSSNYLQFEVFMTEDCPNTNTYTFHLTDGVAITYSSAQVTGVCDGNPQILTFTFEQNSLQNEGMWIYVPLQIRTNSNVFPPDIVLWIGPDENDPNNIGWDIDYQGNNFHHGNLLFWQGFASNQLYIP